MSDRLQILIVEDDQVLGPSLLQRFALEGFAARLAATGAQALRELEQNRPNIVVSDIRLPDMNGETVFRQVTDIGGLIPFYFMTAHGELDQAVRLMKAGARDYLTKPIDADALVDALQRDACFEAAAETTAAARDTEPAAMAAHRSPAMRRADAMLAKFARTDMPVLLRGETGVGKEVAARRLHELGRGQGRPFVAVNCAAIPTDLLESTLFGHEKGAFTGASARKVGLAEQAGDGTLFLDEIAELQPELQAKLLRLLQEGVFLPLGAAAERRFGGRVVAATHADLEAWIADGRFRDDLYYRINALELTIPPLRERTEDLACLASMLLEEANGRLQGPARSLSAEAATALAAHPWPGNVRELRNRISRAVVLADGPEIGVDDLFPEGQLDDGKVAEMAAGALGDAAKSAVRERVQAALERTGGNQSKAARLLGVSRTTIWKYSR